MTDIVERAREYAHNLGGDPQDYLVWQLADEIKRLQSIIKKQMSPTEISRRLAKCNELSDAYAEQLVEIERLRAALQEVSDLCKTSPADPFLADNMDRIARRALEPKP